MGLSPAEAGAHAEALGFTPRRTPVVLTGGNLNHVYRVFTERGSVVLKHAPPYIATDPSTPLDPSRLDFEVRALGVVPATPLVRCPAVLAHSPERSVAIFEDLGELPNLEEWLPTGDPERLGELGVWIARLHQLEDAQAFANPGVQRTREQLQYLGVRHWLRAVGTPDEQAADHAEELGRRFCEPGRCMVMGDLWTRSVLVGEQLHVIDWELCHFGVPAQDLGHLAAHLWMLEHRRGAPRAAMEHFLNTYDGRLTDQDRRDLRWHSGAEILARTIGPFRRGYLYAELQPDDPLVREAVSEGVRRLC